MNVIGITGGIASGKTLIVQNLARRGYPTYLADERAKCLMEQDAALRSEIRRLFGDEAYTAESRLNRAHIAQQIFSSPVLRQKLNALVHPRTIADFLDWVQVRAKEGYPALFKEAALTIEAGAWQGLSALVVVYAPWPLRLQRLMARDQLSLSSAAIRLQSQWPDWHKLSYADYILLNDGRQSAEALVEGLLRTFGLPAFLETS